MDPLSEMKIQQHQDQTLLSFPPLFAPSPGFAFDNQDLDDSFSFPINCHLLQQQDLPDSLDPVLDPYYYPWNGHQAAPIDLPPPSYSADAFPQPAPETSTSSWCMGGSQLQLGPPMTTTAAPVPPPTPIDKKEHHNASERMRRMRLNGLFAALSSVLPGADQKTAPSTVERVIKYIPELREEVEALIQRKQQLLPSTSCPSDVVLPPQVPAAGPASTAALAWSADATELGNGEISVLISTPKSLINTFVPISEVLRLLEEEEGLLVIHISSSDSSAGRVFYHIHLIEEGTHKINSESLRTKLLSSYQKWEEMCLWMITQGM